MKAFLRAQIEEKERRRKEEQRQRELEERLEEERLAKEQMKLQEELLREQDKQKRKEVCVVGVWVHVCAYMSE